MHWSPTRTTTVLAADAANYSRAMSLDERRALAALTASRAVIDAAIEANGGRIFSTGGDSVLAEFPLARGAVTCAVDAQRLLAEAKAGGTETLPYRIGIHSGHVYPNGDDLLVRPSTSPRGSKASPIRAAFAFQIGSLELLSRRSIFPLK